MRTMRLLSTALALTAALATAAPALAVPANPQQRTMRLSADSIAFYYDRFLVEADGDVRVTSGDGLTITGSTLTWDLKNNRFMIAGGVKVVSPSGEQEGAALADFLDFDRVYFVPITSEPDRWTFENGDYAHPIKGREMPGDTFAFPDLSHDIPYLYAKSAVVGEHDYVRFQSVTTTIGRMRSMPLPTYYVDYSSDPKLAQNSLSGANFDGTWQFAGDRNFISAIHLRYDQDNKAFLAFEQHLASKKAYAVFSVNPFTRASKFFNLVTDYRFGDTTELHTFSELHTVQNGFTQPEQAQHVTSARLTQAFRQFSASLTWQTVNYCLLGTGDQRDANGVVTVYQACGRGGSLVGEPLSVSHPQQWNLDLSSFDVPRRYSPVKVRFRAGLGYIHDGCTNFDPTLGHCVNSLQVLNGAVYTTIGTKYVGATAFMPSFKIGVRNNPTKTYYLNASLDAQRLWYTVPHHVDEIDGLASISRVFDDKLSSYLSYEVRQTSDRYNTAADRAVTYPTNIVYQDPNYASFAAFVGSSTMRTLSFGTNYSPTPDLHFSILARQHRDFPIPVPGLFQPPPLNVLGQYVSPYFLGEPPYDLTGEARFRILKHYYLDISRTYYFNYGTLKWSPSFVIQVSQ